MNVKIVDFNTKSEVEARIIRVSKNKSKLPSITDGWRFNFNKHSKQPEFETYILITNDAPEIIEGCLIINTKTEYQVYMAFVEIAPHNKAEHKKHDRVAGCLIAFACKQSFINDKEGYLAFDVIEEKKEDEKKLMQLYSRKYKALRLDNSTTMIITPEGSKTLINEFLK
jgi:hypothetical protein